MAPAMRRKLGNVFATSRSVSKELHGHIALVFVQFGVGPQLFWEMYIFNIAIPFTLSSIWVEVFFLPICLTWFHFRFLSAAYDFLRHFGTSTGSILLAAG